MYRKRPVHKKRKGDPHQELRVKLPRDKEIFGIVEQLHGGKRMHVRCADGKIRMCRIPGRLRRIWVRPDDIVLVEPWPIQGDKKGDVVWRYRGAEVDWLKQRGYLKDL
jgi:translation initiation factor 1A